MPIQNVATLLENLVVAEAAIVMLDRLHSAASRFRDSLGGTPRVVLARRTDASVTTAS